MAVHNEKFSFGTLASLNKKDNVDELEESFTDSEGSHHRVEIIQARVFEIFDKKRLVYDIKEKETTISDLIEAI